MTSSAGSTDVPLLVIATARPELLERRPGLGRRQAQRLDPRAGAAVVRPDGRPARRRAGPGDLPADVERTLLDRADGNPLYAEQFAQLYLEQGPAASAAMPETLTGIVSARLDTLSADEKAALQDGAVMGKVFWTGAVNSSVESAPLLLALARKGFLTRQRHSSVEQETEWSFAHMLIRDVSYGQIPRADRSAKHRRAAEWIGRQGRPEDHADLLAYHWGSALRLARGGRSRDRRPGRAGADGVAGRRAIGPMP